MKKNNPCNLERKIEETRNQMIETIKKNGVNDPETIKISQKLDSLLNQLNRG
ncbi:aspartyl-phosphate phosphatase Spo0E family protein [Radiobacillus sp. PE A8.2]|uniref:aspartyl-phosphate phosphatase Spo0E family protein n=1 Tax=Radiobacillus sp. PE A8.2 TaxID=3380349 RepID=UPI00388D1F8C